MRRSEKEIAEPGEIARILSEARLLFLGLVDEGQAYIVPLNFGFHRGFLYFHSARKGRKIELLKKDPRCSFTAVLDQEIVPAEKACHWSSKYRSAMGTGRVVFVEDPQERQEALDSILRKVAPGPFHYDPVVLSRTLVARIEINSLSGKKS